MDVGSSVYMLLRVKALDLDNVHISTEAVKSDTDNSLSDRLLYLTVVFLGSWIDYTASTTSLLEVRSKRD